MSETPSPPQVSPDGKFYWDGTRWVPMQTTGVADASQQPGVQRASDLAATGTTLDAVLQADINRYVQKGFRVVSQTSRTAQLVKPKKFSFLFAFLWFLLLGVGVLVYIFYYAAKKDQLVYLTVNDQGQVTRR